MTSIDWLPGWATDIKFGDAITWLLAAAGAYLAFRRVRTMFAPLVELVQSIREFLSEWNGTPAMVDQSGAEKEPAKPGVLARLGLLEAQMQSVRHQVKNDHSTNLRDDLDKVIAKVDEHVAIAKKSDAAQAEIAEKVARLDARWGEGQKTRAAQRGGPSQDRGDEHDHDA